MYVVFMRTWWRENPDYPDGLEPHLGARDVIATVETEGEARALCREINATNDPGRLSYKAEYEYTER